MARRGTKKREVPPPLRPQRGNGLQRKGRGAVHRLPSVTLFPVLSLKLFCIVGTGTKAWGHLELENVELIIGRDPGQCPTPHSPDFEG